MCDPFNGNARTPVNIAAPTIARPNRETRQVVTFAEDTLNGRVLSDSQFVKRWVG